MWKGGRLKLEKAKEHYLFRLRREWTEDAHLEIKLSSENVGADESVNAIQKPKKDQDIEKMQLKIFFPKLRKVIRSSIKLYAVSLFKFVVFLMTPAHYFSYGVAIPSF